MGTRFIHYEVREGIIVAVFALDMPPLDWGWEDDQEQVGETVFDRPSLEARLANLWAAGAPAEATAAALAGWPQAENLIPGTARPPADRQVTPRQKTDAVLRLLRGEAPEEIADSLGIPVAALMIWRDAFLAAGSSAL
ncbi:MAG: hypothetical protein IRY87_27175 [Acetobacteraceae bacterium]|nr:hypothetical protein [Acetobacteraceae bacterium]